MPYEIKPDEVDAVLGVTTYHRVYFKPFGLQLAANQPLPEQASNTTTHH